MSDRQSPDEPAILYTQAGCGDSARVRAWLTARDIPFLERNVTRDLDAARALYATGIFATPLLVVGDQNVLGFRESDLTAALAPSSKANPSDSP